MATKKTARAKKLDRTALDRLAEVFRAFADGTRLALLQELKDGPKNVNQLLAATGTTQANVSRQLKLLHAAGLLHREQCGPFVCYSIADDVVLEMCNAACGKLSRAVAHAPVPEFFHLVAKRKPSVGASEDLGIGQLAAPARHRAEVSRQVPKPR